MGLTQRIQTLLGFPTQSIRAEVNFLSKLVEPEWRYFDIGANAGTETSIFLRLKARQVISVEPDRDNARHLRSKFKRNPKVIVIERAAGEKEEKKTFYVTDKGSSYNTLSTKWKESLENPSHNRFGMKASFDNYDVTVTTLDALIDAYGEPDCIKIDVEGGELDTIKGLSKSVPLLWFEANFPQFKPETIEAIRRLAALDRSTRFNYTVQALYDPGVHFIMPAWSQADEIISHLKTTPFPYLEIFAKTS